MPKQVWRLQTGKIFRKENGVLIKHVAPFDFVPEPYELEANRFRMIFVQELPDEDTTPKASESTTSKASDPGKASEADRKVTVAGTVPSTESVKALVAIINITTSEAELDGMFEIECSRPQPRNSVLTAIEKRRDALKNPVVADIQAAENKKD
jgi:hypothetical protein